VSDLSFHIGKVKTPSFTAVPMISARLHVANGFKDESTQSVQLSAQVQLQPLGRLTPRLRKRDCSIYLANWSAGAQP
jgi:hypothetical protein